MERPTRGAFGLFNRGFTAATNGYGWLAGRVVRIAGVMLVVYVGIIAAGGYIFSHAPSGFIPQQDRNYLIGVAQLPPGASLSRTDEVVRRMVDIALKTPGVSHVINIVGFSGATFTNAPNAAAMFLVLDLFDKRAGNPNLSADAIQRTLFGKFAPIQEGLVLVVQPPAVQGIGNAGGFRMMVEDRAGQGPAALQNAAYAMMGKAAQTPGLVQVFTLFENQTPQIYLEIDRTKVELLGINVPDVFTTLQTYIGSLYVNDFNLFGRTFRVQAQAASPYRLDPQDVLNLRVRNSREIPFRSVHSQRRGISPDLTGAALQHYPRPSSMGRPRPGFARAGHRHHGAARQASSAGGFKFEWTTLAYQRSAPATRPRSRSGSAWCSCSWYWPRSSKA